MKRLLTTIFNVKSWLDVKRLQTGKRFIVEQVETYFIPGRAKKIESFETAVARLNLSEAELLTRQKGLLRLSITMLCAAFLVFLYTLYNLFYTYYAAVLVGTVVMLLALVMSFRYHFWYFQIKHRKLGCSLREWFTQVILGVKSE